MKNPKLVAEFIGTFFLLSVVAFSGNPFAIGAVLTVLVYSSGHISGAHFNPAVTLAFYLKGVLSKKEAWSYVAAQFLGGVAAMLFFTTVQAERFAPQPANQTSLITALIVEVVFTFLLVRTILLVAADPKLKGNQFFGVAIGAALMIGAYVGGPVSGGAFNPVVGIVPHLFTIPQPATATSLLILYTVGPLLGGWLAQFVDTKYSR